MNLLPLMCEQAIFTSARGPTGEGYRIIAASRGLRSEEKQKITRCSPSHESLCAPAGASGESFAVAWFPVSKDRVCAAYSCHAGAEHTGRGGQRVYTHNLVFAQSDLARAGYNPFAVLRAARRLRFDRPITDVGAVLPPVELTLAAQESIPSFRRFSEWLPPPARLTALERLLDGQSIIVDIAGEWCDWTEGFLMGIPAPLRAGLSFAAGMRFSTTRAHQLHVFQDENGAVQARAATQGSNFIDAQTGQPPSSSHWLRFVERHWVKNDLGGLCRRTSRPFEDCSPPARQRIGELYNQIDAVHETDVLHLFAQVVRSLHASVTGLEREIQGEFRSAALGALLDRFSRSGWPQIQPVWNLVVECWRKGKEAADFVQPLLRPALLAASKDNALLAAELALAVASPRTEQGHGAGGVNRSPEETLFQELLARLRNTAATGKSDQLVQLAKVIARWRTVRPDWPILAELAKRCAQPAA